MGHTNASASACRGRGGVKHQLCRRLEGLREGDRENQHASGRGIVQPCPCVGHSPFNPTDVKVFKLTVIPNSLPVRFARFALGGYELGGRRGAPSKRRNRHPVCSQNATSLKSRDLDISDDRDMVRHLSRLARLHPHDKSDVIFR